MIQGRGLRPEGRAVTHHHAVARPALRRVGLTVMLRCWVVEVGDLGQCTRHAAVRADDGERVVALRIQGDGRSNCGGGPVRLDVSRVAWLPKVVTRIEYR